ncbi:SR1 protein [Seinonella peptonophila]|uniref:SR1 protein n=1 Tax=Seinonella peptonophila TaxID=112248 RepID=A0A1M4V1B0_9BACL|nr:GapA-binding peptide SR1P [Seinonella peptonophila]SHE62781.1 SR1 protein [Seinonella peptonophila]
MEVLVCQNCDQIITYLEQGKSGVLYGKCTHCIQHDQKKEKGVIQTMLTSQAK